MFQSDFCLFCQKPEVLSARNPANPVGRANFHLEEQTEYFC